MSNEDGGDFPGRDSSEDEQRSAPRVTKGAQNDAASAGVKAVAGTKGALGKRSRPSRPKRPGAPPRNAPVTKRPDGNDNLVEATATSGGPPILPPQSFVQEEAELDALLESDPGVRAVGTQGSVEGFVTDNSNDELEIHRRTTTSYDIPVLDLDATLGANPFSAETRSMQVMSLPESSEEKAPSPIVWKERKLPTPSDLQQWLESAEVSAEARAAVLGGLSKKAADAGDNHRAAVLAHEAGAVWERELKKVAVAAKWYGLSLKYDPQFRANLWAIRRVFYRRELWPNLTQLLRAEIGFSSPEQQADLWLEKALVEELQQGDLQAAQESLTSAIGANPKEPQVHIALARVSAKAGNAVLGELALRGLVATANGDDRRVEYALDLCRYLEKEKRYQAAWDVLAEISKCDYERLRVARAMERVGRRLEDDGIVAATLETQAQCAAEAKDAVTAGLLYSRCADFFRKCGNLEGSWRCLEKAVDGNPSESLLLEYAALASELGKQKEATWARQQISGAESPDVSGDKEQLDKLHGYLLSGNYQEADALAKEVGSSWAPVQSFAVTLRQLISVGDCKEIVASFANHAKLAASGALYGQASPELADSELASRWFVLAADVAGRHCGDNGRAELLYRAALSVEPNNLGAVVGLATLLENQNQPAEAADVLSLFAGPETEGERIQRLQWLGDLYAALGSVVDARKVLMALEEIAPSDKLNLRLAELDRASGDSVAEVARLLAVAENLALDEKQDVLWRCLDITEAKMQGITESAESATDDGSFLELCQKLRGADANEQAVLRREAEYYANSGDRANFAQALSKLLDDAEGSELKAICFSLAELLSDPDVTVSQIADDAVSLWRQGDTRSLTPKFARAFYGGLSGGSSEALPAAWKEIADSSEGDSRSRALVAQGAAYERNGDLENAMACYQEAADAGNKPAALAAFELGLAGLSKGDGQQSLLAAFAQARTCFPELAVDEMWSRLLLDGGEKGVADSSVNSGDAVLQSLDGAVAAAASAIKEGDSVQAQSAFSAMATLAESKENRAKFLVVSALYAFQSGDPSVAWSYLVEAWKQDGRMPVAVAILDCFPTVDTLTMSWAEVRSVYPAVCAYRADRCSTKQDRLLWYRRAGDFFLACGDFDSAKDVANEMLGHDADSLFALDLLRQVFKNDISETGQERLAGVLRRMADLVSSIDNRVELLLQAGRIYEGAGQKAEAIKAYKDILAIDAENSIYDRIKVLLVESGSWQDLFDVLELRLEQVSGVARGKILYERGRLRNERRELDEAERDLSLAFELNPTNPDCLLLLSDVCTDLGQLSRAATLLGLFLEKHPKHSWAGSVATERAELLLELGEESEAVDQFRNALETEPEDKAIRNRLVGALLETGEHDAAVIELEALAELARNPDEKIDVLLKAAKIAKPGIQRTATLQRAVKLNPCNTKAIAALAADAAGAEGGEQKQKQAKIWLDGANELRGAIAKDPGDSYHYEQLATCLASAGLICAERLALEALGSLEPLSKRQNEHLQTLCQQKTGKVTTPVFDPRLFEIAATVSETDALVGVWQDIAGKVSSLQPSATDIGFSKGEKIRFRDLRASYPALAAIFEASKCSVGDFYVSKNRDDFVRVLGVESPDICIAENTAQLNDETSRYRVGWALAQVKNGTAPLVEGGPEEFSMWIAAAAEIAGCAKPKFAERRNTGDAVKLLGKLPRKAKKSLADRQSLFTSLEDPGSLWRAHVAFGCRLGLAMSESVTTASRLAEAPVRLNLLAWAVSEEFAAYLQKGESRTTEGESK